MTWRNSVPWHLFLHMPISLKPFKLHTDACGTDLGAVLYQTWEDGTKAVIAYACRSLSKAKSHYPAHKVGVSLPQVGSGWEIPLVLVWVNLWHVHPDNNPLTYILTMVKLDTASHHWVTNLANYNFRLHYRAGKTNIDAEALLRVSWPGYMPDSSGTHLKVTVCSSAQLYKRLLFKGLVSPIEAYSCDLHILDTV